VIHYLTGGIAFGLLLLALLATMQFDPDR